MRLKYIHEYRDYCTGKLRRYFRKKGRRKLALPGDPASIEFITAYTGSLLLALAEKLRNENR
jgi:hypothetical protein